MPFLADIPKHLIDFLIGFSDADHDARLASASGIRDVAKDRQRSLVASLRTDRRVHPLHSLDVVGENLRCGGDEYVKITGVTLEVTHERLNRGVRGFAVNRPNRIGPGSGTAVRQVIPVHAGHNNVPKIERGDGRRDSPRLAGVDRQRFTRPDIAEST